MSRGEDSSKVLKALKDTWNHFSQLVWSSLFLAYLGTKHAGFVSPKLDMESKVGILDGGVHVLPEYRRQRIGTTLLLTALKWLRKKGMEKVKVTPFNPEGEIEVLRSLLGGLDDIKALNITVMGRCNSGLKMSSLLLTGKLARDDKENRAALILAVSVQ